MRQLSEGGPASWFDAVLTCRVRAVCARRVIAPEKVSALAAFPSRQTRKMMDDRNTSLNYSIIYFDII
jgi:hypothetical protein